MTGSAQATFCATLVDEWIRCGLRHAVVAPGSRSAPLALALAARAASGDLDLHVVLDEREAGFVAVGIGVATGRPALVLTTSGTAAAELHPAVLEAHHAGAPVLVCTADRPSELHHVGAPQTIEQEALFAGITRWSVAPGVPDVATSPSWRSLAARAWSEAAAGPLGPGPVHCNLAFREPLAEAAGELPPPAPGGGAWHTVHRAPAPPADEVVEVLSAALGRRGLIVAGAGGGDPAAVLHLAGRLRWPVLADPRSGCRVPDELVVAAGDSLLRSPAFAGGAAPEVILRLGAPWASRVVNTWLAASDAQHVLVDPHNRWTDPDRTAAIVATADPGELCWTVADAVPEGRVDAEWLRTWREAESAAQSAIDQVLALHPEATEPGVARDLVAGLPEGTILLTASSMPVRDVEWFGGPRRGLDVYANRGVNGIDGLVATAVGMATGSQRPVVALLGDLAFLHGSNGLLAADSGIDLTLVVVDNAGGGIFSFLPYAPDVDADRFSQLFATPQRADIPALAAAYGLQTARVEKASELIPAVNAALDGGGPHLVHVVVPDHATNVALHDELNAAVATAVADR